MSLILALDYGSSSLKAVLLSTGGEMLAEEAQNIPVFAHQAGWVEQDSDAGWQGVCAIIQTLLHKVQRAVGQIAAIAVTGTTNLTLFDHAGRTLRPAILYGDTRLPPAEDMHFILERIGEKGIAAFFGLEKADPNQQTFILRTLPSSKLLWLRKNEPEIFARARHWVTTSWDMMILRLTGTSTFLEEDLHLDQQIGNLFGIPDASWGQACRRGQIVGTVSAEAASLTGLQKGTPVVVSARDSLCSFLGAGIHRPGMVLNQGGTTDVIAVSCDRPPQAQVGYPVQSLVEGLWFLSLSPQRGSALKWIRDLLFPGQDSYRMLDDLAAQAPPGSRGLIFLPYLLGEKAVVHDPWARGAFLGIDTLHTSAHLARAVLEGIAFGLRDILGEYAKAGLAIDEIRLGGGAARSPIWNQIKADILGREVKILAVPETGCLGAAILAARTLHLLPDLPGACDAMVHIQATIQPDPHRIEIYDRGYEAFRSIYPSCKNIFPILADLRSGAQGIS
jgi:xylulokinase